MCGGPMIVEIDKSFLVGRGKRRRIPAIGEPMGRDCKEAAPPQLPYPIDQLVSCQERPSITKSWHHRRR